MEKPVAEPLKTFFSPALVRRLAADLARAHEHFPTRTFVREASRGLDQLELLDRGRHIARALAAHLPGSYPEALAVLLRSLGPEHATGELIGAGMAPFFYLPHTLFVAQHGLAHFDLSMDAQVELTKRFSAEASVRPYIAHDPERAWGFLRRWALDPNPHVRRLVSEGTRLRLPWAPRVAWLEAHPERVLELLELLKDDPASLVQRSVANNLNDLGRVRLDLLLRTAAAWQVQAPPARVELLEHALRGALRRGDAGALRLLGYGQVPRVRLQAVTFDPRRVPIGQHVSVNVTLRSSASRVQHLRVDLAVTFVKAHGAKQPKVFVLGRHRLAPGAALELTKRVSLAVHTTRVPRPGRHTVALVVNGRSLRAGSFDVVAPRAAAKPRPSHPARPRHRAG
jgi:3-methyladenine DNA glycosylase AlkC